MTISRTFRIFLSALAPVLFSLQIAAAPAHLPGSLTTQYELRLVAIDTADPVQRFELGQWLFEKYDEKSRNIEALDLSLMELDAALELDPETPHAKALHALVKEKRTEVHKRLNPDFMKMAFSVIGGLGLFLLGMKNMSEGMQAVAGQRLRRMIRLATDKPIFAVGTGVIVTCLIQSSSITTVLVVGFVNSGLMLLHQAIGVVIGANIGTTITGWILVLKIGKWGLPIIGIAAFVFLFSRSERARYTAMAVLGLGMVFFGLEMMKNGFKPMKEFPPFEAAFEIFQAHTYFGVLKCAMIGCLLTFIVQSSSATLGITIGLAQVGAIPFETAAALVLGENIGTTITAWLASLGANTNAKRAAYAHVMFNVIGVAWVTAAFSIVMPLVGWIVTTMTGSSPIGMTPANTEDSALFETVITAGIATTHSAFNITNTLLFLPFVRRFAAFLEKLVPDRKIKETPHLTYLDIRMLDTPNLGIQQSLDEIKRMAKSVRKMMDMFRETYEGTQLPEEKRKKIFRREEILDTVQKEITEYLSGMLSGHVPHHVLNEGRQQLRMADEYESISDYVVNLLKLHLRMHRQNIDLTAEGKDELRTLHDAVAEFIDSVSAHLDTPGPDLLPRATTDADTITHMVKDFRDRHLARVGEQTSSPLKSLIYTDMLTAYRKIKAHTYNIAEALAGVK